jgi:hypothetical protein
LFLGNTAKKVLDFYGNNRYNGHMMIDKEIQMKRFALFQLPEESKFIRDLYFMNSKEIAEISDEYRMVALINGKTLDDVFTIGNIGPESSIERVEPMHSVSVGDIIQDVIDGKTYVVAKYGFEEIDMKEVA